MCNRFIYHTEVFVLMRSDIYLVIVYAFMGLLAFLFFQIEPLFPQPDFFFLVVLVTVAVTRIVLYIKPISAPTIRDFETHHYMYGFMMMLVGVVVQNLFVYSIGFGLLVDELAFFLMRGKSSKDYQANKSTYGTVFFVIIAYFLRDRLLWGF